MGEIAKGAKTLASRCPKCNHPEKNHLKIEHRDQQRLNPSTKKIYSECKDCRNENKQCKYYLTKK